MSGGVPGAPRDSFTVFRFPPDQTFLRSNNPGPPPCLQGRIQAASPQEGRPWDTPKLTRAGAQPAALLPENHPHPLPSIPTCLEGNPVQLGLRNQEDGERGSSRHCPGRPAARCTPREAAPQPAARRWAGPAEPPGVCQRPPEVSGPRATVARAHVHVERREPRARGPVNWRQWRRGPGLGAPVGQGSGPRAPSLWGDSVFCRRDLPSGDP